MRKILFLLLSAMFFVACGGNSKTNSASQDPFETFISAYEQACENGDFLEATSLAAEFDAAYPNAEPTYEQMLRINEANNKLYNNNENLQMLENELENALDQLLQ